MACLLTCQSPGILNMDVVDVAFADAACCFVTMTAAVEARRPYRRRSLLVKSWILERHACGTYNKLSNFSDLLNINKTSYRMDLPAFEELLSRVEFTLTNNQKSIYSVRCSRTALRCE